MERSSKQEEVCTGGSSTRWLRQGVLVLSRGETPTNCCVPVCVCVQQAGCGKPAHSRSSMQSPPKHQQHHQLTCRSCIPQTET